MAQVKTFLHSNIDLSRSRDLYQLSSDYGLRAKSYPLLIFVIKFFWNTAMSVCLHVV